MRSSGIRLALVATAVLALAIAAPAAADPFHWTNQAGPFAWEMKRLSCGVAGKTNRLRAHSRWRTSPENGYQRTTFVRQERREDKSGWTTVQRRQRATKNTKLEGVQTVLHWWQHFPVPVGAGGELSRNVISVEWLLDRGGRDRRVKLRSRTFNGCRVRG